MGLWPKEKHRVLESGDWECVDCGIKTLPGRDFEIHNCVRGMELLKANARPTSTPTPKAIPVPEVPSKRMLGDYV